MAWTPPLTLKEKLKKYIVPPKIYIKALVKMHLRKGEDELHLLPFLTNKHKDSIDIGANKGVFSYLLSKLSSRVHAFEPNPKMYDILKRMGRNNILTYRVALSSKTGFASLLVPMDEKTKTFSNEGATLSKVNVSGANKSVDVEIKTLDSYSFDNIGFIKIDVEGYEMEVLKGAVETLKKNKPILLVELEESHTKRPIMNLIKEIEGYGYRAAFLRKKQITDISLFDAQTYHKNPKTTEDYVFNFLFFPIS
tara:strand:- start:1169 stop:1921 length:753 start_codon:yes stop_codon:yes gene_type:complete